MPVVEDVGLIFNFVIAKSIGGERTARTLRSLQFWRVNGLVLFLLDNTSSFRSALEICDDRRCLEQFGSGCRVCAAFYVLHKLLQKDRLMVY